MMKKEKDYRFLDEMRNDPGNYILGVFYFNRKDPNLIVPKRTRVLGWTVNFASIYAWLFLIALIIIGVLFG